MTTDLPRDYNTAPWRKVPIAELTAYRPGHVCCAPSFWAVLDECVLFYEGRRGHSSPQRNTNPAVVKHLHPTLEARFIEQAYMRARDA